VEEIMIRRIISTLAALIIILAIVSTAVASNGTQIGTVGAKSTAMGSAFRGLADDWSAAYFNPAGITQFSGKWEIGLSLGMIMPRGSYQAYPYADRPFAGLSTEKVDATARNFLVPAMGVFYKATEKLSLGLSVYAPNGLGTEWDLISVPAAYGNPGAISKEKEFFSDHQVIDIQPTVAYKLSEKLSVGLGVKYTWGKMDLREVMLPLTDLQIYNAYGGQLPIQTIDALLGGIKQIGLLSPALPDIDPNRVIADINLEGTGFAYGANLGVLFKASEKLSIGLSGRYSTDLKLKGDFKITAGMPDFRNHVDALVGAGQLDATTAAGLKAKFNGTNQPLADVKDVEANLPLPMVIGGGIAFKANERLTVTADASFTNWKAWDKIEITKDGKAVNEFELNWENTLEIGAGVEWLAKQTECKKLFLRLGGYTVDSPVPDETMNPTLLDPSRRYVVTGGFGLKMGKISIDLAYEHVFFAQKDIPASKYVVGAEGYPMNFAGKYNFNANVITLATTISL
jgi:long-chain fatty acid transport protein